MALVACGTAAAQDRELVGFGPGFDVAAVGTHDARVSLAPGPVLRMETGHAERWPGIVLKAPGGHWDLSDCAYVSASVKNAGSDAARVGIRVDNPGADGRDHCIQDIRTLQPGETAAITADISATRTRFSSPVKLVGMRGVPGGSSTLDPAKVTQVLLFADHPSADGVLEVRAIRAGGTVRTIDAATFFPFIDAFGQYSHNDWPGKTHSEADLEAAAERKAIDLQEHTGPADWDAYGGWAAGPKLEATGFFRRAEARRPLVACRPGRPALLVARHRLRAREQRRDADHRPRALLRRPARRRLAVRRGSTARRSGRRTDTTQGRGAYETFDFSGANLCRKYGTGLAGRSSPTSAHRRLRSWGLNTIGQLVGRRHLPAGPHALRRVGQPRRPVDRG